MARRHGGRLAALLIASIVAGACTAGVDATTTTTSANTTTSPTSTSTTTTSPPSTSTTTIPASEPTTTISPTSTTVPEPVDIDAVIRVPEGAGPFPAVVLAHGGGWILGDTGLMADLAVFLTNEGFLTLNTSYRLSNDTPGFPGAVEDIACAVNFARSLPEADGTVAVIGHSAGAHLSAVVGLTGDSYVEGCPVSGSGLPERLVGLAGPYDVDRLGVLMLPFFGAPPNELPDAWVAGNPMRLTGENPDLVSLIMYGDKDGLVADQYAVDFHRALVESGSESLLERVEGARHMDMRDPDWVGDLIVTWLER